MEKEEIIHYDMLGFVLKEGDRVVYGKSDRNKPIKLGKIIRFEGDSVVIQGDGNSRPGKIWNRDGFQRRIALLGDTTGRENKFK